MTTMTLSYGELNNPVMARAFEKVRLGKFSARRTRAVVELGKVLQENMDIMKVTLTQLREAHRNGQVSDAKIGIPTKDWLDLLAQTFTVDFEPFTEAELDGLDLSVDEMESLFPLSHVE